MKLLAILLLAAAVVGTVVAGDESLAVSPDSGNNSIEDGTQQPALHPDTPPAVDDDTATPSSNVNPLEQAVEATRRLELIQALNADSPASSFVQLGDKAAPAAVETAPVDASMTDSTSAESESQAPDAENEDVDVDEDESARFAEEEDDDSEDTEDSEEDNDEDDDESDNNYDDDADDESTEEQEEENYEDGAAQALIQETEDEEDATEEDNNESVDEDAADVSDNEVQLESSDQDEQEEDIRSFLEVDEHDEDDNEEDDDDEDDDEDADDEEDALESEEDDAEDATDAQEQRFAEEGAADEETTERLAEEEGDDHGDENAVDEMRFAQLKKQEVADNVVDETGDDNSVDDTDTHFRFIQQTAQADPAAGPERAAENKNAPTNLQAKAKSTPPTDQSPPRSLALSGGAGPPPAGAINPFPFPPHKVVGQPAPLVTDLLKQNGINVLKPNVAANKNNPLSAVLGVTVLSNRNGNADAAACNCVGQANCACEPCPCALMVGPCACRAQISLSSVDPAKLTLIPKQSSTIVLDDCDNPPCSPEHEHQVFSSTHEEKVSFSSPESNRNQDFEQVTMLRPNAVNQLTGETMLRPAAVCTRQPC